MALRAILSNLIQIKYELERLHGEQEDVGSVPSSFKMSFSLLRVRQKGENLESVGLRLLSVSGLR